MILECKVIRAHRQSIQILKLAGGVSCLTSVQKSSGYSEIERLPCPYPFLTDRWSLRFYQPPWRFIMLNCRILTCYRIAYHQRDSTKVWECKHWKLSEQILYQPILFAITQCQVLISVRTRKVDLSYLSPQWPSKHIELFCSSDSSLDLVSFIWLLSFTNGMRTSRVTVHSCAQSPNWHIFPPIHYTVRYYDLISIRSWYLWEFGLRRKAVHCIMRFKEPWV